MHWICDIFLTYWILNCTLMSPCSSPSLCMPLQNQPNLRTLNFFEKEGIIMCKCNKWYVDKKWLSSLGNEVIKKKKKVLSINEVKHFKWAMISALTQGKQQKGSQKYHGVHPIVILCIPWRYEVSVVLTAFRGELVYNSWVPHAPSFI